MGKLMPRIKRIGNMFEIEPEFGEDRYGKPTGSLRDAFLVYAMHLFRDGNYIDAYYHYNMAHQKEKSVLSSYMLLSCLLKLSAPAELIRDVYDDALTVVEESKDLKGHKYCMQKFISGESLKENRARLALEEFLSELRKEVNQFEIETLSWFSAKDTLRK